MSKLTRETMLVFASEAGANQVEQFGSLAGGSPNYTMDVAVIQALSAWLEGWFGGVVGSNLPAIQDLNAICYVFAYQLSYLFQAGIAEWDADTVYYENSFVQVAGTVYTSLTDSNTGNNPVSSPSFWGSPFQTTVQEFAATGNFTAPAGVTRVTVVADFPTQGEDFKNAENSNSSGNFIYIDPDNDIWVGGNAPQILPLGDGSTDVNEPQFLNTPGFEYREVGFAPNNGMAIDTFGALWMWGDNTEGQMGNGTVTPTSSPVAVLGKIYFSKFAKGTGSGSFMSVLDASGKLWAWGSNVAGVLGDGTNTPRSSPVAVLGSHVFSEVSQQSSCTLGIDTTNQMWAWGENNNGQLGDGTFADKSSPVSVLGTHNWRTVTPFVPAGVGVMALDTAGKMWGWGDNSSGSIGDGTIVSKSSPVAVLGSIVFTDIIRGHTNAGITAGGIDSNGKIWLWGSNASGQLGDGTTVPKSSPIMVAGSQIFSHVWTSGFVDSGVVTTWGLDTSGGLWAWGSNAKGVLGANISTATNAVSSPVAVAGSTKWRWLWPITSGGIGNSTGVIGMDVNGQLWGWGSFPFTPQIASSPVMLPFPPRPMITQAPPKRVEIAVTPGQTYAVQIGWACSFGGTIVGYLAKSLTVEYVG